jgi:hypothetical protein
MTLGKMALAVAISPSLARRLRRDALVVPISVRTRASLRADSKEKRIEKTAYPDPARGSAQQPAYQPI